MLEMNDPAPDRFDQLRSWVATRTVVPPALMSRNRFMISSDKVRIEVAGRLVGQDELRLVDQRARDGDALLLAARQLLGEGIQTMLQADPLDHLIGAAALLLDRLAQHARANETFSNTVFAGSA